MYCKEKTIFSFMARLKSSSGDIIQKVFAAIFGHVDLFR